MSNHTKDEQDRKEREEKARLVEAVRTAMTGAWNTINQFRTRHERQHLRPFTFVEYLADLGNEEAYTVWVYWDDLCLVDDRRLVRVINRTNPDLLRTEPVNLGSLHVHQLRTLAQELNRLRALVEGHNCTAICA